MYCRVGGIYYECINKVQFENLKTKYSIDEDIAVNYTLHNNVRQIPSVSMLIINNLNLVIATPSYFI